MPVSRFSPPRLAGGHGHHSLEMRGPGLALLHQADPQAIDATYWFDAAPDGDPYPVHVRVDGVLRGEAPAGASGSFSVVGSVSQVIPGSGRVALTVRVPNIPRGTWDVTATPVEPARTSKAQWAPVRDPRLPTARACGTTTFGPLAANRAPGARLGAWPALVTTGAALAILVQLTLAAGVGLPVRGLVVVSVVASLLGLAGAKLYYLAGHRTQRGGLLVAGMSIQGFVLVAVASLLAGTLLLGLPVGTVLDVTTPGLLVGMAVGRLGCLLGGCCAGRPTASRWGMWLSDRSLGTRRIPVQLLESGLTAVLAVLTLLAVLAWQTAAGGLVFLAGVAAYTAGRQLLFPLRSIPRATSHGRTVTLWLSSAVLVAVLVLAGLAVA